MTTIDTTLFLPQDPGLEGLEFRGYGGDHEISAIAELERIANASVGSTEVWSEDEWRNEMRNVPNVDPRVDYLGAWVGHQLVAWSRINWADTSDSVRHYRSLGIVHPDWRRRGIGSAMLERNEIRLRQLAAHHEHVKPPRLVTVLEDGDHGGLALVRAHGYDRVRIYHHMVRPDMDRIDVPPLPEGLEIRPITEADLPRIWDALVEAFRDHFGGHDVSPEARQAWLDDPARDLRLWAVAFDGEEVAAGVLGYVMADENEAHGYRRGWADPVFTRRPWRRRGLARALLGRCLLLLRDAGMTSAQLDVDTENPADAHLLYRGHRFETDRGSSEWHKPLLEAASV